MYYVAHAGYCKCLPLLVRVVCASSYRLRIRSSTMCGTHLKESARFFLGCMSITSLVSLAITGFIMYRNEQHFQALVINKTMHWHINWCLCCVFL